MTDFLSDKKVRGGHAALNFKRRELAMTVVVCNDIDLTVLSEFECIKSRCNCDDNTEDLDQELKPDDALCTLHSSNLSA